MKVKICGIRRVEDALAACAAGADAIGVLVGQKHFSKDFIDVNNARSIITALPPLVSSVLVTHEVDRMAIDALLSFSQQHYNFMPKAQSKILNGSVRDFHFLKF